MMTEFDYESEASDKNKLIPLASIPSEHFREPINNYCQVPIWNLIIAKEDFINKVVNNNIEDFTYNYHIKSYWSSLKNVERIIKNKSQWAYYKLSLMGYIFTIDYSLKYVYHSTINFLRLRGHNKELSRKEMILNSLLEDYPKYLKNNYWYDYDFMLRVRGVFKSKKSKGDKLSFSEIEKTLFLVTTYTAKQVLASIVKMINKIGYWEPGKTTVVEMDYYPPEWGDNKEISVVGEYRKHILLKLPRYKELKDYFKKIEDKNNVYTIAGNNQQLIVSCIFKEQNKISAVQLKPLFISEPNNLGEIRVFYIMSVTFLKGFLRYCQERRIILERVFDY